MAGVLGLVALISATLDRIPAADPGSAGQSAAQPPGSGSEPAATPPPGALRTSGTPRSDSPCLRPWSRRARSRWSRPCAGQTADRTTILLELPEGAAAAGGLAVTTEPTVESLQVSVDGSAVEPAEVPDARNAWVITPPSGAAPSRWKFATSSTAPLFAASRPAPVGPSLSSLRSRALPAAISRSTIAISALDVLNVYCPAAPSQNAIMCGRLDGDRWTVTLPAGLPLVVAQLGPAGAGLTAGRRRQRRRTSGAVPASRQSKHLSRADITRAPRASLVTTTTARPGGSACTSSRMTSSAGTPAALKRTRTRRADAVGTGPPTSAPSNTQVISACVLAASEPKRGHEAGALVLQRQSPYPVLVTL